MNRTSRRGSPRLAIPMLVSAVVCSLLGPVSILCQRAGLAAAEEAEKRDSPKGQRGIRLSASSATTQVFGIKSTGSKFVYVLDRSRSMGFLQGEPLRSAKSELLASLKDLDSMHQFQIVFYNESTTVLNPFRTWPPRILRGTEENKNSAGDSVNGISPAGGTNHFEALRLALGMRPNVVYLLTDADDPKMTPSELEEIRRRNGGYSMIHVVEFGSGKFQGRDDFLVRLAQQNRGQHLYIDVTDLAAKGSP